MMTAKRTYIGIGIIIGLAALALLWSLFRPELLFVNATVNEPPPAAVVSMSPAAMSADKAAQSTAVAMSPSDAMVKSTAAATSNDAIVQPTAVAMSMEEAVQATAPAVVAPVAEAAPTTVSAAPVTWSAHFQSLAHETNGTADIRTLEDGSRVLRLEDFATSNGPDVRVYLVRGTDGTQDEAIKNGEFIDLGALKGNIGDQNYVIPAEVDLSQYQAVSIWCRRFSVNFGATVLEG